MGFGEGGVGSSCVEGCSSFCEFSGVGLIRFTLGILGEGERDAADNVERGEDCRGDGRGGLRGEKDRGGELPRSIAL